MTDILTQLQAELASRYQIEREVGRGGMATVYLAQDQRHHRPVAVKVLHPHIGMGLGPDRFLREIQIAARLQHPHIVPLYDSGRAGDLLYYVMPFVPGESLRQRLERTGTLPLQDAVRIARGVATALDYAHRQQVVHRDIKPENIMLHDDEPVVTDFGIAKAVSSAVSDSLTQTGMAIGTPSYMSPEQAGGGEELDGRADIYSLGAVLYEMLCGAAPFTGPTVQAVMKQLFTDPVIPVRNRREGVPDWLDQVVTRALAKTAAERYGSATQFAQALIWPSGQGTPPGLPAGTHSGWTSIAVLPFVNMSADAENEYFSDGIAEEIINALSRIEALRVASRTSSFAFKGKSEDIGGIGRTLKVDTVLEGSVRKAGNRLRVTAQLINVADGYQLWSERFDRQLEDVFAIQDEIADNIVRALRVVLSDEEKKVADKPPTEDVRAYEYYLRGRQYFHMWSRVGIQHARRMFERAIEVDPNFATAYAAMADCCAFMYMYWDGSKANLDGADSASRKALELGPNLAEAHASRGFALSLKREHAEAREEFERAIALNPRLYEAHYLYARACRQEGDLAGAVKHFEAASTVRPEDYQSVLLMAGPLKSLGRDAESAAAYRKGLGLARQHLELTPDDGRALCLGAAALMTMGEVAQAIEWATQARAANPTDATVLYNVACVYALGKAPSDALDALDQAVANGFGHREWLLHDSDLDAVRADPRFEALLAKL